MHTIQRYVGTSPSHGHGEFRIEGHPIYEDIQALDTDWNNICNNTNNTIKENIKKLKENLELYFYIKRINHIVFVDFISFIRGYNNTLDDE